MYRPARYPRGVANILCLDFDDTIVLDNTWRQLRERFVDASAWREVRKRGPLSVEQTNAAGLDLIEPSVTRDELEDAALAVARPRAGLLELTDWAHWNGWVVAVVSLGFDFYIDPILDQIGLKRAARHMGRTRNDFRWRVRYNSPRGIELTGGFKVSYAQSFAATGDFVAYIGDGESDVEAGNMAPAVFARSTLLERLSGSHPCVYPFDTFHDAVAVLEREADGWLRSFSSTTAAGA